MAEETEDDLVAILEAIAQDRTSTIPQGKDRLSTAIRILALKRRAEAVARLDKVVHNTMGVNELAAACAAIQVSSENMHGAAESVASTSEQLSASVRSIEEQVSESRTLTTGVHTAASESHSLLQTAVAGTQRTTEEMRAAAHKTKALALASRKIATMVGTIDSIAMQTNLLALNASVEAARAGKVGRGFSVVAQEVRALSEQTSKATSDIRDLVRTLESEVSAIAGVVSGAEAAAVDGRAQLETLASTMTTLIDSAGLVDDRMTTASRAVSEQAAATVALADIASRSNDLAQENLTRVDRAEESLADLISLAGTELSEVARIEAPNKIARLAKADHVIWKKRLADMFTGRLSLKPDELADHHRCRLGQWYYGPDAADFRTLLAFRALEAPHAQVHSAGIRAVTAFNAGDRQEALKHLDDVEQASKEVLRLLDLLIAEDGQTNIASAA